MNSFMVMIFESSVAIVLFYGYYYFFLRHETFFVANRWFLLLTAAVSLIIPWVTFSIQVSTGPTMVFYNVLETVTVTANGYESQIIQTITGWQWASMIYLAGVFAMGTVFVYRLIQVFLLAHKQVKVPSQNKPENVVFVNNSVVPFSFLNRIYINVSKYSKEQVDKIIAHELVHIRQRHTFDCLFYELLIVLFWFHPIVYRYRKSAKEIHEFLADKGAIQSGIQKADYQELLFTQATGLKLLTLPNSFNYSLLKRRLIMLTKIKSSKWARVRLFYAVPLLLAIMLVFACNQSQPTEVIENIDKGNESTSQTTDEMQITSDVIDVENKKVYLNVEKMPEFPGGIDEIRAFIAKNVAYPPKAKETGTEGRVYVSFVVTENGSVDLVKHIATKTPVKEKNEVGEIVVVGYKDIDQKEGERYSDLVAEAIRVVKTLPQWTPGEQDGVKVNVQFTLPINFRLQ